jgi:hypothetical protein
MLDLPNHSTSCCALDIIGKLLMSWGAPSPIHNVLTYSGEVIKYFSQEFQTHSYSEQVTVPLLLSHVALRSKIVQYQFCMFNNFFSSLLKSIHTYSSIALRIKTCAKNNCNIDLVWILVGGWVHTPDPS